ncbi:MAG: TolC family protein [Spirochaetaceae bacterium]|jgi:outer membrane protein TolC|nr:TolC family protein [Spirochaetaceae bacterium]
MFNRIGFREKSGFRTVTALFLLTGICASLPVWGGGRKDESAYQALPPEGFDSAVYAVELPKGSSASQVDPESVTLTVDKAVQYALDNSAAMKSASIDLGTKKRQKDNAWNVFIPGVSVNGTMARRNEVTDTAGAMMSGISESMKPIYEALRIPFSEPPATEIEEADHWNAMLGVTASLNLSYALVDGIQATKANYEAGLITLEQTRKQTERDIRKMFYAILLMQENLTIQKEMLVTAEQRVEQSRINYRNGLVPELSVLQAQVAAENRKPAIQELEQSLSQQLDMFAFLLGFPYGTKPVLEGSISSEFIELDAESLISSQMGSRLDIISLAKNIELLEIQRSALVHQTYTPAVALSWGWQPTVLKINESWIESDNVMDNGTFSATIAFNITNMLPFSSQGQNIKDLEANIMKLRLNMAQLVQSSEMDINMLIQKLNKSESSIAVSKLNIDLAQRAYDMTMVAFRNGTTELLDVRDSENQLNQAQLGLIQEQYNYVTGLLDLEYALNMKLTNTAE